MNNLKELVIIWIRKKRYLEKSEKRNDISHLYGYENLEFGQIREKLLETLGISNYFNNWDKGRKRNRCLLFPFLKIPVTILLISQR